MGFLLSRLLRWMSEFRKWPEAPDRVSDQWIRDHRRLTDDDTDYQGPAWTWPIDWHARGRRIQRDDN
jgi:hypothetical protein